VAIRDQDFVSGFISKIVLLQVSDR